MGKIDDTILGKIFWLRNEDLDNIEEYYKMREKYEKKVNVNLAEKSIIKFFNENVKNEYKREEFKKLVDFVKESNFYRDIYGNIRYLSILGGYEDAILR